MNGIAETEVSQPEVEAPETEQPQNEGGTETGDSENQDNQNVEPRVYAGKFESDTDLEAGYLNVEQAKSRAEQEAAYWRKMAEQALENKHVSQPEPAAQEPDLVEYLRETYPEDPVLHKMGEKLTKLEQVTSQFQQSAGITNAQRLTGEFKAIYEQNTAIFSNPELDAEVADLLADMLPAGVNIQQVIQNAAAGVPMPDWVATDIPRKLRKAVAAVSKRATPGAATERVKTAEKRTAAMAGSLAPGSSAPKAPSNKIDISKMTPEEAGRYIDSLGRG